MNGHSWRLMLSLFQPQFLDPQSMSQWFQEFERRWFLGIMWGHLQWTLQYFTEYLGWIRCPGIGYVSVYNKRKISLLEKKIIVHPIYQTFINTKHTHTHNEHDMYVAKKNQSAFSLFLCCLQRETMDNFNQIDKWKFNTAFFSLEDGS